MKEENKPETENVPNAAFLQSVAELEKCFNRPLTELEKALMQNGYIAGFQDAADRLQPTLTALELNEK